MATQVVAGTPGSTLQSITESQLESLHKQKMSVVSFQAEKHFGSLFRRLTLEEPEFALDWGKTYT